MGTRARIASGGMSRSFSNLAREWPKLVVVGLFMLAVHSGSAADPAGETRYSLSRDSSGSRYSLGAPSSGSSGTRRYSLTNEEAPAWDSRFGSSFPSDLRSPLSNRVQPASAEIPDTGAFTPSGFERVETEFTQAANGVRPAEWTASATRTHGAVQEIEAVSHTTAAGPTADGEPQALSILASTARELAPASQSTIALPAAQTTTLRLEPGQAVFLGIAIVLFLLSQTAIVWALRKQAIAVSTSRPTDGDDAFGRQMAGFLRPFITARRDTAVFDFTNDSSLITDGPGTTSDQWQAEEETLRQQEQMIIEEVVSVNVALGPELSKG